MAEFALGLTKTAVEGTVSRVNAAIADEKKLKFRVQNDLVFITGEFQMMQSFLNVANAERAKNEVVRTWVRQIRDLAFDVEDCVELVVSLDIKSGWSWLWRVLPGCMAPPRPLDEAVAEIQRLKARVEDVSHRNSRYNLIGDSGGSSSISSSSSKHALLVTTNNAASPAAGASSPFSILHGVWEAAGKTRRDMRDLKRVIANQGDDLEVISVCVSPGSSTDLGMTSIVRTAYNNPDICKKFKTRAWVKLMHPFNLEEFLRSLLTQLYGATASSSRDPQENLEPCFRTAEEYHVIKGKLMQHVIQERYLVVVEELSTMVEWDTIRTYLPDNKNGSRIVMMTRQLGLALACTGEPYQVSDLGQSSDGHYLCAFFNKVSGRRSDMGELIWQLRFGGLISVWGCNPRRSSILDKVYTGITLKSKELEGLEFENHVWVDVPVPFKLEVFSRHLFLNFHSHDLRAKEISEAVGDTDVIRQCCMFLCEHKCLVIINGLRSTHDWDLIKAAFLSKPIKGCILVTTYEQSVATYCAAKRVFDINHLEVNVLLRRMIEGYEYFGIGSEDCSSRGRFFYNRRNEAYAWIKKFELFVIENRWYYWYFTKNLQDPGVISLCGTSSIEKSAITRRVYYQQMLFLHEGGMPHANARYGYPLPNFGFKKFSWVEVPHPFSLTDFSCRLLLDFYSDDLEAKAKQIGDIGMMIGKRAPINDCLKFLLEEKCFVVIRGLRSTNDWNLISDALLTEPIKGCILVITDEKSVATHCVHHQDRVLSINVGDLPVTEIKRYSEQHMTRAFSSRMVKAREWANNVEIIGRSIATKNCKDSFEQFDLRVMSVWGTAGVGKSALVRNFYHDGMLSHSECSAIKNVTRYGWVDVPQSFNLTDLSSHLLMDFNADDLEVKETVAIGMMEEQDPIQWCSEFLNQERCFVVIDGLRSTEDWDLIKSAFLSKSFRSCIIVITNEESVATYCVDNKQNVINVKSLAGDWALLLFKKITGARLTSDEEELSQLTTKKCGGLPKIITAVGEYYNSWRPFNEKWLEIINADFMVLLETSPAFHSLRGIFVWMQSYFDDCTDSLKPCIFYLPVFPLGHNIRLRRLLRRWIAEGYCRDTPGSAAETNGETFLLELERLSIIQRWYSHGKVKLCLVNGFVREYIISRPMQDNLVFALEGHCIQNSQRVGQHLTISSSWDRDKILYESMEFSRLRSLTVFGDWRPFFIPADVGMKLLRVLDLEDTLGVTNGDIEHIGKLLPRLKFLSLRGCKDITRLPSSMGNMRQLQTMDIKGTSIVTLPPGIMKLEKLQYVRAGTMSTSENGTVAGVARPLPSEGVGASTSQAPTIASSPSTTPPPPPDADGESSSRAMVVAPTDDDETQPSTPCGCRPLEHVCSWLSKLRGHGLVRNPDDGVQFPVSAAMRIERFTALHTLGFINVGVPDGSVILRELKKLTQLRKLRLSGISRNNWHDFCFVISGHSYLESLSVRLKEEPTGDAPEFACFSDISDPPTTLRTLKVHGENARISLPWVMQLHRLRRADVELTISSREEYAMYSRSRDLRDLFTRTREQLEIIIP